VTRLVFFRKRKINIFLKAKQVMFYIMWLDLNSKNSWQMFTKRIFIKYMQAQKLWKS